VATLKLLDESWRREEDHAKWGVTSDKQWICIGDINREVLLMLCWLDLESRFKYVFVLYVTSVKVLQLSHFANSDLLQLMKHVYETINNLHCVFFLL